MTGEHERFEQLAVGHVLGGLSAADAANFRSHLLGCRDCRSRVAELRGIAADLADAERDERSQERVRTELPRRTVEETETEQRVGGRLTIRHVTVAVVVVVVLATAMAFWNLHLRTSTAAYLNAAESQSETLAGLADGVPLEPELRSGVTGLAVTDGESVSLTLSGLDPLGDDEYLVAWLLEGDEAEGRQLAAPGGLDEGRVATTLETGGATELVLSRETRTDADGPSDDRVLQAALVAGE